MDIIILEAQGDSQSFKFYVNNKIIGSNAQKVP